MLLAAGTVALFGHVSIANPLGDQFMDPRLGLMLLLISSTAAVLGLQSRVAEQLALSGPCRWRASWLLVLCGLLVGEVSGRLGVGLVMVDSPSERAHRTTRASH